MTVFALYGLDKNMYIIDDEFHFFYEWPTNEDLSDIYFNVSWINNGTLAKCHAILNTNIQSEIYNTAKFIQSAFKLSSETLSISKYFPSFKCQYYNVFHHSFLYILINYIVK